MMTRPGRRRSVLVLALLILAPTLAAAETLGEAYRRVNPSVVVIRAKGSEVTEEGVSRFRAAGRHLDLAGLGRPSRRRGGEAHRLRSHPGR